MAIRRKGLNFEITGKDKTGAAFDKVRARMRAFGQQVGRIAKAGAKIGVAVAAGLALIAKKSIDAADRIAKVADSIGITTGTLQELRFAADLSGVSIAGLDSGLQAFGKRIGELRGDTGTLVEFLKKFDPAFLEILKGARSVDVGFDLIIRKMASLEDQTARSALGAAAFGRSVGIEMTNLIRGGIDELDRMRRKARDLGIVIDDALLRKAEKAKDQLTILATVIKANVIVAVLRFADRIADLTKRLTEGLPVLIDWVEAFGKMVGLLDSTPVEVLADLEAEAAGLERRMRRNIDAFGEWAAGFPNANLKADLDEVNRKLEVQRAVLREIAETGTTPPGTKPAGTGTGTGDPAGTGTAADETAKKIEAVRQQLVFEREQLGRTAQGQELYNLAKRAGVEINAAFVAQVQPLVLALRAEKQAKDDAAKAAEKLADQQDEAARIAERLGQTIDDALVGSLERVGNQLTADELSWRSFAQVAVDAIAQVVRALAAAGLFTFGATPGSGAGGTGRAGGVGNPGAGGGFTAVQANLAKPSSSSSGGTVTLINRSGTELQATSARRGPNGDLDVEIDRAVGRALRGGGQASQAVFSLVGGGPVPVAR